MPKPGAWPIGCGGYGAFSSVTYSEVRLFCSHSWRSHGCASSNFAGVRERVARQRREVANLTDRFTQAERRLSGTVKWPLRVVSERIAAGQHDRRLSSGNVTHPKPPAANGCFRSFWPENRREASRREEWPH